MKIFPKMCAKSKTLPKQQTQTKQNRLQHAVIPTPLFAPWGNKAHERYQTNERKSSHDIHCFHYFISLKF